MKGGANASLPFRLPEELAASSPPEARGLERDRVRLLIARPSGLEHATFRDLGDFLDPGDVVVVNTSATFPAAADATRDGERIVVHFSAPLDDGSWTVELRTADASRPLLDGHSGQVIDLDGGGRLEIRSSFLGIEGRSRMLTVEVFVEGTVESFLSGHGRPITYSYLDGQWPLASYQTVFAREAGSAEMPSAGRPFTTELVTDLVTRGIVVAPITLHAGVSSLERGELPLPERFRVATFTARIVNALRASGGRVVAVGTTVVRALESAADEEGFVQASGGWTDLVLGPERPARVVTGLITGWHEPQASHQLLLRAVAGEDLVDSAYASALEERYLWHEFGDSCLLLPGGNLAHPALV